MSPNGVTLDQQGITYDPKLAYTQMLVNSFISLLSPQELPRNMTARMYMDEELWMPIRILAKLPALDHLLISDVMFPFVTQTLYNSAADYLEVDVIHEIVRPKWALRSSVYISNVDIYATADQVFGLLEDLCSSETYPNNPFEFDNIIISKQTANSWSISFKSPSAGPYAAMSMKSKFINGSIVFPTACVHITPPRAAYWNMDILVTEVDAMQYGNPVIPIGYVQHYSKNPSHLNQPHNTSAMGRQEPMQNENARPGTIPFFAPALRERSSSNQSFCTQLSVGNENEIDGYSSLQTPQTDDQCEHESHSTADLDTINTKSEAKNESENITQNDIAFPDSDRGTAKQEPKVVLNPNEAPLGTSPLPTRKLNNSTPPNEISHHTASKIPDKDEPTEVFKIGGQAAAQTIVESPENKLHSSSPQETDDMGGIKAVKTTEDAEDDWHEGFENASTIPYPKPENLHTPSFAKQDHLEMSCSGERKEEQMQKERVPSQLKPSPQTFGSSKTNLRFVVNPDGAIGTRKERKERRVNNRAHSGERRNGKGRNRQPPQGGRKHHRKGSGDSPNGERHPDNSSNGSGTRKRNGHNKKPRNKGQRFNSENQQRSSHINGEGQDHQKDLSNAAHMEFARDKNCPYVHRAEGRDEGWQTISYQRLRSKRNRRSYSTSEGSSHNRGRQNGNQQDSHLRSSSSHSFS